MRRNIYIAIAVVAACIAFAFGRAIANGAYFGECDHAEGQQCYIVRVLGVVMHKDKPKLESTAEQQASCGCDLQPNQPSTPESPNEALAKRGREEAEAAGTYKTNCDYSDAQSRRECEGHGSGMP